MYLSNEMRSIRRFAIAPLAVGFLLVACPVQASTLDVFGNFCGQPGAAPVTCGETATGVSGPSAPSGINGSPISFDFVSASGGTSSNVAASGGVAAAASATSAFGLLRATASASNSHPLGTQPLPLAIARSLVTFRDEGTVNSVSLVTGFPAHGKATLDVDGIFGGLGEATIKLFISSNLQGSLVNFQGGLFGFGQIGQDAIFKEFDLNLVIGETLAVDLSLGAVAGAGNSDFTHVASASADVGHSAHFFLDFLTDDVTFGALSGHNYSAAAEPTVVPEPGTMALLALALAGLGMSRRRGVRQ